MSDGEGHGEGHGEGEDIPHACIMTHTYHDIIFTYTTIDMVKGISQWDGHFVVFTCIEIGRIAFVY